MGVFILKSERIKQPLYSVNGCISRSINATLKPYSYHGINQKLCYIILSACREREALLALHNIASNFNVKLNLG